MRLHIEVLMKSKFCRSGMLVLNRYFGVGTWPCNFLCLRQELSRAGWSSCPVCYTASTLKSTLVGKSKACILYDWGSACLKASLETRGTISTIIWHEKRAHGLMADLEIKFPGSTFIKILKSHGTDGRYLVLFVGPFESFLDIGRDRGDIAIHSWDISQMGPD